MEWCPEPVPYYALSFPSLAKWANGLHICQWNVQRLTDSKLEEIRSLLTRPGNEHDRLDILILSETFCTQKVPDSFYNTDGCQLHQKDRMGKSGGGILVYVNNSIQILQRFYEWMFLKFHGA